MCPKQQSDDDGSVKAPSEDEASDIRTTYSDMAAVMKGAAAKAAVAAQTAGAQKAGGMGGGPPDLPYADDDAGSEGGQSAMSAQSSSGGAEYKRGKRFRKLVKLMDSGQAQQVRGGVAVGGLPSQVPRCGEL